MEFGGNPFVGGAAAPAGLTALPIQDIAHH